VVQIPNSLESLFGKEGLREFEARGLKADVETALMRLDDMGANLDSRLRGNDRIRCSRMMPGDRGCPVGARFIAPLHEFPP
jgi:hypothetical protein